MNSKLKPNYKYRIELPGNWNPQDIQEIVNCLYSCEDKIDPARFESVAQTARRLQIDPKIFPIGKSLEAPKSTNEIKVEIDKDEASKMFCPPQKTDPATSDCSLVKVKSDSDASTFKGHRTKILRVCPPVSKENVVNVRTSRNVKKEQPKMKPVYPLQASNNQSMFKREEK